MSRLPSGSARPFRRYSRNPCQRMLRPLCPTRWSVRLSAVDAVLNQYGQVRATLQQLADSSSHISVRAAGLHDQMSKAGTCVALWLARQCLQPLDRLCLLAQRKDVTVSQLCEGLENTKEYFESFRSGADDSIAAAFAEADKLGWLRWRSRGRKGSRRDTTMAQMPITLTHRRSTCGKNC